MPLMMSTDDIQCEWPGKLQLICVIRDDLPKLRCYSYSYLFGTSSFEALRRFSLLFPSSTIPGWWRIGEEAGKKFYSDDDGAFNEDDFIILEAREEIDFRGGRSVCNTFILEGGIVIFIHYLFPMISIHRFGFGGRLFIQMTNLSCCHDDLRWRGDDQSLWWPALQPFIVDDNLTWWPFVTLTYSNCLLRIVPLITRGGDTIPIYSIPRDVNDVVTIICHSCCCIFSRYYYSYYHWLTDDDPLTIQFSIIVFWLPRVA